ncbi:MAG: hypothetical protein QUV20_14740 [Oceanibaculum nanhaiense]|uniref:hypothetical protein n=1 Tax=Oceanibaculum nanhaiense TaxID=1909734 RepID=UPI0025A3B75B|nr:hypothetical protein [Oceanibaculum nanhaiense]MDM7947580.1 hypothetical protein [Oceanibaculum nanhaiense]
MLAIIRTDRADEDLIALWTSIAADDPNAADRVPDAIERRCDRSLDIIRLIL